MHATFREAASRRLAPYLQAKRELHLRISLDESGGEPFYHRRAGSGSK